MVDFVNIFPSFWALEGREGFIIHLDAMFVHVIAITKKSYSCTSAAEENILPFLDPSDQSFDINVCRCSCLISLRARSSLSIGSNHKVFEDCMLHVGH